jgi:hypothetical protein
MEYPVIYTIYCVSVEKLTSKLQWNWTGESQSKLKHNSQEFCVSEDITLYIQIHWTMSHVILGLPCSLAYNNKLTVKNATFWSITFSGTD